MCVPEFNDPRDQPAKGVSLTFRIFSVAVLLNYAWEVLQSPLYEHMQSKWWHCFLASIGDGFLVLIVFAVGWLVFRRPDWFRGGVPAIALMVATGLVIATGVEWVAVHRLARWTYTSRMPLVPGFDIGAIPVAQMVVLPPLVFCVAGRTAGERRDR